MQKLRDIMAPYAVYDYTPGTKNGIFSCLYRYASTQTDPIEIPFLPDAPTAMLLDTYYYDGHSGEKPPSPLVKNMIAGFTYKTQACEQIAEMLWALHGANLLKQWAVLQTEYNPIENYNMTEDSTDANTGTDTTTHTGGYTDTTTNRTIENDIYGFDSASATPSDKSTENGTQARTYNSEQNEIEHDTLLTHNLSRSGNIGTTTQQMLQSELELWQWNFYNNYLFPVVDSVLTLLIY